jgi:hypothetical protein
MMTDAQVATPVCVAPVLPGHDRRQRRSLNWNATCAAASAWNSAAAVQAQPLRAAARQAGQKDETMRSGLPSLGETIT